ncbi:hypothetical protein M0R89_02360 [Halorussus limi]|uniref:DUF7344 domain-containing protein n=1 Tax=Halorussus limi TaxID=2938695 RepID=A0A8U0HV48_9EURY|nr:hypothetical protein [Halorussus limi]UPV74920.1 hypothetical protein M0R89_02360 [Halorussus limi]
MAATNPEHVSLETTFDLLGSAVRRTLVRVLDESGTVTRDDLTERVASVEADGPADERARRQVRIALHHNHLPRLAEAGLVVYDDETVTGTSRLDAVASEITRFDESERTLVRS